MARRPRRRAELEALAAELAPEDGADPQRFFQHLARTPKAWRVQALCSEVARAVALSLPPDLSLVGVTPAPDASRLCVTLGYDPSAAGLEPLQSSLGALQARLRAEVARSVRRRKAPELTLQLRPHPRE